ncbi:hypothetical protein BHE74_00013039 [Ensete ventricosum]|nr:hypothetical protein GW17_00014113 [Ensete ventricosum]RWW78725.1 hypothetical protein BHE74_00013039 [Ensete ventricosum]RZR90706.1 hypothetical protein BHM03_00018671 [Ensete ventricosum]
MTEAEDEEEEKEKRVCMGVGKRVPVGGRDAGPTTSPSPGPRYTHRQMLPHKPRPLPRKARYKAQPSTPTTCGD